MRRLPARLLTRKISTLLDLFGLTSAADQPISGYSKGMKQKVLLIAALLHDPDLLILDEPESGLDLTAGLVLRHLIPILAARGKTILYSSHVLDHVERLCADVVVLHHGRIVAEGPVSQLRAMTQRERIARRRHRAVGHHRRPRAHGRRDRRRLGSQRMNPFRRDADATPAVWCCACFFDASSTTT